MEPNEFAKAVDEGGQIPAMVAEVARRKALAAVLEKADIVDTAGTKIDLDELNVGVDELGYGEGADDEGHEHEAHDEHEDEGADDEHEGHEHA